MARRSWCTAQCTCDAHISTSIYENLRCWAWGCNGGLPCVDVYIWPSYICSESTESPGCQQKYSSDSFSALLPPEGPTEA